MNPTNRQLIAGYKKWVMEHEAKGSQGYLLTFMFNDIPGSEAHVLHVMRNEVERVYSTMATWMVHNPRSPAQAKKLPLLIAMPDWPKAKYVRMSKRLIMPNDGAHMHGMLMVHPTCRLKQNFEAHINSRLDLYLRPPLAIIDVEPITHDIETVFDYISASFAKGRESSEDLIILPRVVSELSSK